MGDLSDLLNRRIDVPEWVIPRAESEVEKEAAENYRRHLTLTRWPLLTSRPGDPQRREHRDQQPDGQGEEPRLG